MMLQRKSEVTRFQILVEVAASQPQIKQSEIAAKLNITPQAVSEYIKSLIEGGMIASGGRGQYKVTPLGVETVISGAKELEDYSKYVLNHVVGQVSVWAAIASERVKKGDIVHMSMRDGILYASLAGEGARGTAADGAAKGEDVGVTGLQGLIPLKRERVKIIKVPSIEGGGSRCVDERRLRSELEGFVGAAGMEALAALNRIGARPGAFFGALDAVAEAATKGVRCTLLVTADFSPQAIQKLEASGVDYVVADVSKE
jgi:putative transcriptional regulator